MNELTTMPNYAILSCNGLDKTAGCIAREAALDLNEQCGYELICPVLYQVTKVYYQKITTNNPILVIDGCQTRCASKLAADKHLKVTNKIIVTDCAKNNGIQLTKSLRLDESGIRLAKIIVSELLKANQTTTVAGTNNINFFPDHLIYEIYKKDKFIFRLPKEGFFFNENDCWVYVHNNRARIGVTDFVQQSLSDIIFFTPPVIGTSIEQFGEIGTIESSKAVFELISPVSGTIVAINEALTNTPELINQNPYEKGWVADIELTNFQEDQELLLDFTGYSQILKRKAEEFHVK